MQNPQQTAGLPKEIIASSPAQGASFDPLIKPKAESSHHPQEEAILGDAGNLADLRKLQDPTRFSKARFQFRLYKRL